MTMIFISDSPKQTIAISVNNFRVQFQTWKRHLEKHQDQEHTIIKVKRT